MKAERVVVDTFVLISAALRPSGPPRAEVEAVRSENGVLVFSEETFGELQSRLSRRKFDKYIGRPRRALFLAQIQAVSEWVAIAGAKLGCRDPDDDKFLETALMGEADGRRSRRQQSGGRVGGVHRNDDECEKRQVGPAKWPGAREAERRACAASCPDHVMRE